MLFYLDDGEERDDLLLDFNRFVDALNDEFDAKRERHKIMKRQLRYHLQGAINLSPSAHPEGEAYREEGEVAAQRWIGRMKITR